MQEVISAVEEVTGKHVPGQMGPRRPGDPPRLVANPAKAPALLRAGLEGSARFARGGGDRMEFHGAENRERRQAKCSLVRKNSEGVDICSSVKLFVLCG